MKYFCRAIFVWILPLFECSTKELPQNKDSWSVKPPLYRIYQNERYGYIDESGVVRIQPVFANAGCFSENLAPVRLKGQWGYIDTSEKFVIHPQFDYAEPFKNGKALVGVDHKIYEIDQKGIRKKNVTNRKKENSGIKHAMQRLSLYEEAVSMGFPEVTEAYKGRRFVRYSDGNWYLTDIEGQKHCATPFKNIWKPEVNDRAGIWEDGLAFVEMQNGGIGAIDDEGRFKIRPRRFDFPICDFFRIGKALILTQCIKSDSKKTHYKYGYWNWEKDIIVAPRFHAIDEQAFLHDGLIRVLEGTRYGYIDQGGEYVWREERTSGRPLQALNIDFILANEFYAASPTDKQFSGLGGWAASENIFKKHEYNSMFEQGKIQIIADAAVPRTYNKQYLGFALYLSNTTQDTLVLEVSDSRLYMYLQAKDSKGVWRNIMYSPSSWCGNSFHKIFLPPGRFWSFTVPVMQGGLETKLRVVLKDKDAQGNILYVSNEFEGGVNPGQFWRRPGYEHSSFMRSYHE
jgi:WG containing repeat